MDEQQEPEVEPETHNPKVLPLQNEIQINILENGFIIRIGCKAFVAKTWQEASEGLALYFDIPKEAQLKYCRKEKP